MGSSKHGDNKLCKTDRQVLAMLRNCIDPLRRGVREAVFVDAPVQTPMECDACGQRPRDALQRRGRQFTVKPPQCDPAGATYSWVCGDCYWGAWRKAESEGETGG